MPKIPSINAMAQVEYIPARRCIVTDVNNMVAKANRKPAESNPYWINPIKLIVLRIIIMLVVSACDEILLRKM